MKKRYVLLMTCLLAAGSLIGCGKKDSAGSTEVSSESEDSEITGYLVDDAAQYVTLGTYKGMDVERPVYTVSDDEVAVEVDNTLYEYSTTEPVDRAAEDGDLLTIDVTATVEGETEPTLMEEDYTIQLGYEEFGADFDQQLIGSSAGDSKEFSCSFSDDTWYEEWVDQTVNFEVTVNSVDEEIIPDYTDEFVTDTLGYDSKEDFEAALRDELEALYQEQTDYETKENAILAAMEGCEFNGYPDKLYDTCEESVTETYASFADMSGMTLDELYDAYGMTQDDLDTEIMDTVNRRLFISALCQAEDLSVTSSEYAQYLDLQYPDYGYEDAQTFEGDYGKDYLMWMLYEDKAATFLVNNATLYDAPVSLDEEELEVYDEDEMDTEGDTLDGLSMDDEASSDVAEDETEEETALDEEADSEEETVADEGADTDLEVEVETEAETL